eukprot:gnl/TRDRNA2_/TRDRNA2_175043_c2_seq3.p1 gnl/TRDRNA2_/TRDRNA2_175043_c2~~gnl/TRDRNA2_/TRDRNA2_175043_c2_seq3.p1  ORF type:complete len:484 (-),score=127.34 gnl/TRDRNA2_/TRDRNA2_175043_c2_seq3:419-1870(-)
MSRHRRVGGCTVGPSSHHAMNANRYNEEIVNSVPQWQSDPPVTSPQEGPLAKRDARTRRWINIRKSESNINGGGDIGITPKGPHGRSGVPSAPKLEDPLRGVPSSEKDSAQRSVTNISTLLRKHGHRTAEQPADIATEKARRVVFATWRLEKKQAAKVFRQYDSDKDGFLDRQDVIKYFKYEFNLEVSPAEVDQIFLQILPCNARGVSAGQLQLLKKVVGLVSNEAHSARNAWQLCRENKHQHLEQLLQPPQQEEEAQHLRMQHQAQELEQLEQLSPQPQQQCHRLQHQERQQELHPTRQQKEEEQFHQHEYRQQLEEHEEQVEQRRQRHRQFLLQLLLQSQQKQAPQQEEEQQQQWCEQWQQQEKQAQHVPQEMHLQQPLAAEQVLARQDSSMPNMLVAVPATLQQQQRQGMCCIMVPMPMATVVCVPQQISQTPAASRQPAELPMHHVAREDLMVNSCNTMGFETDDEHFDDRYMPCTVYQ